jgi:hypothetical protein
MSKSATLALKITGDASGAVRAMDDAEGRSSRFGGALGKIGAGVGVAIGALGALGVASFNAASDLEQSTGAINAVFGDWAVDIEQSAQKAAGSIGLSTSAYEQLASVLGAQLSGAGFDHGQMVDATQELIAKGADLAATFGGTTADAVEALSSVLKGETDPIERYGVSLKQSDISARLAAQGQDKLTGEALKQAQAQAALALVTEQTTSSQGAAAKESGSAASRAQQLSATFDNLKAKIGAGLLPVFSALAGFVMSRVIPAVEGLFRKGGPLANIFTQVGAIIGGQVIPAITSLWNWLAPKLLPILGEVGRFISKVVVPAFRGIWSFIAAYVVPIFQRVAGPVLGAVRSVFHTVTDAIERNRGRFSALFQAVRPVFEFLRDKVAPFLGGAFKTAFEVLGTVIGTVVDAIGWIVDKIRWLIDKGSDVVEFIGGLFGGGAPAPSTFGAAAPMRGAARGGGLLVGAGSLGGSSSIGGGSGLTAAGDTYQITVNGALDPEAVADQIARMLDRRSRRLGLTPAGGL